MEKRLKLTISTKMREKNEPSIGSRDFAEIESQKTGSLSLMYEREYEWVLFFLIEDRKQSATIRENWSIGMYWDRESRSHPISSYIGYQIELDHIEITKRR